VLTGVILAAALLQAPAQQASALVDAGVELSNRGRFSEAGEKFVRALALDPSLAEAHYLLGLVRQQDGRADAALQSFRAALKIQPAYAQAQARVCELETGFARTRETGYDKAGAACRRAIQLDGSDAESHFHLGWLQSKLGNYAAAVQEYRAVLKFDPKFPGAPYELAMSYVDSQDIDRAIPLLREVTAAEPANTNARFQLGSALVKKDDCVAALPYLETATESSQKHYLLAGCYKKMNRTADAASEFAKVKALREGAEARMQAKYRAAVAHQKAQAGKLDEAIAEYRAVLELVKDPTIAIDLAVALLKKGEAQEVVKLLGGESSPLARYQVALAYSKLGRAADARSTLEQVVRDKPDFVEAWYELGVTSLAAGRREEAERALSRATQLRPDEPAIRMAWARALEGLGKVQEAREQRQLAGTIAK
jgi:tetratricopeptide (TPR) repeat protein